LTKRSGYNYLEGMKAFHKKDKKKLKTIIDEIGEDKYRASLNMLVIPSFHQTKWTSILSVF